MWFRHQAAGVSNVLTLFYGIVLGTSALASDGGPPSDQYKLVWCDEFDGKELDKAKWGYRNLGPRRKATNVKKMVALDGQGHLVLTTERVGDDIHTAMIGTQGTFSTTFGYFECCVKLQPSHGHWSAFWLQSPTLGNQIGDAKTSGTEIDIYECFEPRNEWVSHNLHWDGYGQHHQHVGSGHRPVPRLLEGFHTFGLEWTRDSYIFYVDGKKSWVSTKAVSHAQQYIILSLEVGPKQEKVIREKDNFTDSVYFDYVRVYQKRTALPSRS